jgi:hypothetical protein
MASVTVRINPLKYENDNMYGLSAIAGLVNKAKSRYCARDSRVSNGVHQGSVRFR